MTDEPKLFCEMTPEEKATLASKVDGVRVIEYWNGRQWHPVPLASLTPVTMTFMQFLAYRARPQPEREIVTLGYSADFGVEDCPDGTSTHYITFARIDGKPDCEKCPACGTARHVDMEEV